MPALPRPPFPVRIHDTRTRELVTVTPTHDDGVIRIYTCGPTVYAPQHIGNLRSQVFPDLLRRALEASGLPVRHVINITDVGHLTDDASEGEDKIERAARGEAVTAAEIAARYTAQWLRDRAAVGCLEPSVLSKATDHIPEMIAMIRDIEAAGSTYLISDGLYFDVTTFPHYTELARLNLDAAETTGRIDHVAEKRHPADFALWKLSPPGVQRQQEWDSPWGVGFPGWHIECSAMATRYLGVHLDLHTGGVDHIGVHHTNEIAQSETALGVHPWVGCWAHNEFLNLAGAKMSKSTGGAPLLDDIRAEGIDPLSFRFFLLQAHYRTQQEFTLDALRAAATAHQRLRERVADWKQSADAGEADAARCAPFQARFWDAVGDDLNLPKALAVISDVDSSDALTDADKLALLLDFDAVLGLDLAHAESSVLDVDAADDDVQQLVTARQAARDQRDWAAADALRDEIAARGYEVIDTPTGPQLRRRA